VEYFDWIRGSYLSCLSSVLFINKIIETYILQMISTFYHIDSRTHNLATIQTRRLHLHVMFGKCDGCSCSSIVLTEVILCAFDIRVSVQRSMIFFLITTIKMQLFLIISKRLYIVSGGSSAHRHEHITVHSVSSIVNQYCCRLVSWMRWNCSIGWQYLKLSVQGCAPDDGQRNHPKHVEPFRNK